MWNKFLGESDKDINDSLDTLEVDLNNMVDELFPQILGFSECDREDSRVWFENDDSGFQILNDNEIVSIVQEENGPSHGEAFTALKTALSWFEK